jgi:hypothetical protein
MSCPKSGGRAPGHVNKHLPVFYTTPESGVSFFLQLGEDPFYRSSKIPRAANPLSTERYVLRLLKIDLHCRLQIAELGSKFPARISRRFTAIAELYKNYVLCISSDSVVSVEHQMWQELFAPKQVI